MTPKLKAPFPYFGGKSAIASVVWDRLGDVPNYCEPFFGSGAVLLARPHDEPGIETVNDADGLLCNAWRAIQAAPDEVARWADWPVSECDLHARHVWLVERKAGLQARLEAEPDFFDAKAAGWWIWGMSVWIGGGFCSGNGPWSRVEVAPGAYELRKGDAGQGVHRKRPHLGGEYSAGKGVHRESLSPPNSIVAYMQALSDRLRRVRVCCGDWSRILGPTPTTTHGTTGVFLDPPYSAEAGRDNNLYRVESGDVAHAVREWCIANGDNRELRIALCGYQGEWHDVLEDMGWEAHSWKAHGGYAHLGKGAGRANATREVIWFSPHCVKPERGLFD